MSSISVTNTFTSGTTILSGEVNQNFTDIINGTSDGTKDFNISALTASGTITFDGLSASRALWTNASQVLQVNGVDSAKALFGTGLDMAIYHDGTNAHIDPQESGATTALIINETGADVDLRVEGDTATQLLVVDASADSVEIGTTTQGNIVKINSTGVNLQAGMDLIGSATSDITINTNKFTVAGATGNTVIAGTLAVTGVATLTAQPILSSLTASRAVFSDGSKGLVSNAITGTGNVVMSASPTLTGTIGAAAITATGEINALTAGIGITRTDGTLHVHTATAGVVTASTSANDLVVENSGNTGITVLSPDASAGALYFGTPSDSIGSFIQWDYTTKAMKLATNIVSGMIEIGTGATGTTAITIGDTQKVGIGIAAADGTLHVHTATAGVVTASAAADDLVVENSTNAGISILSPDADVASLYFGSASDSVGAFFQWDYTNTEMTLATNIAGGTIKLGTGASGTAALTLDASQNVTVGGLITASGGISIPTTKNLVMVSDSDILVNTNKFTVAGTTGNTVVAGTLGVTGVTTLTAQPILSSLTASLPVFTDGSKGLVSNAMTGTGNVVMSASPTLTGTAITAAITASGLITANAGVALGDNDNVTFGDGSDATIDWDSLNLVINSGTGECVVRGGNLLLETAGSFIQIETGAVTDSAGQATLIGGNVTIANTNIATGDIIMLTHASSSGTPGILYSAIINATSFDINSSSGTDTAVVNWFIIKPAP